jgi:hypothetical protein
MVSLLVILSTLENNMDKKQQLISILMTVDLDSALEAIDTLAQGMSIQELIDVLEEVNDMQNSLQQTKVGRALL